MSVRAFVPQRVLPQARRALEDFLSSKQDFRVVYSISQVRGVIRNDVEREPYPLKTLFILDSSFNPPQRAHLTLALSALRDAHSSSTRYESPCRLLLLFSTHNADKKPSPAAFEHRLGMMMGFAEDLVEQAAQEGLSGQDQGQSQLDVDVGLTMKPFYNDKTAAIEASKTYDRAGPRHIHIAGYDTFIRIFDAKYYKEFDPPLSALEPYFGRKHGLRVTIRPTDGGQTENEEAGKQKEWVESIGQGRLDAQGARREWANNIELVEAGEGKLISSTRVRQAIENEDWSELERLCTARVTEWIKGLKPYSVKSESQENTNL